MKFSDIVLEARGRLHDIRKVDGTLITLATEDGVRWTSNNLCSIARSAMIEMSRTLIAYDLKNNLAYNVHTRIASGGIYKGDTYGEFKLEETEEMNFYKILSIQNETDKSIYKYVEDEEFFDMAWRNHQATDEEIEEITRKVFTTVYDTAGKKIKILVLPNPISLQTDEAKLDAKAIVKCSLESLYVIGSEVDLPFINSIDLVLDFIIKQARQIEHSVAQVDLLDKVIKQKLGEMKIEQP